MVELIIAFKVVAKNRAMFSKWACLVAWALFSVCDSAFVDKFTKCSYKDDDCITGFVQKLLLDLSEDGAPELKIPPIEPLVIKNKSASIIGLLNVALEEGEVHGIKDCVVNSIHNDVDKGKSNLDITCDIAIKAKFKLNEISPLVENFLGKNLINGNGDMKIKLDKINFKMQFFYHVIKKDDGDIYFKCHLDEFRYNYEIGNFKMTANKIFLDNQDISQFIVGFMNQNWRVMMPTFGKGLVDMAIDMFKELLNNFFENAPAKYYLTDDLTSLVQN